MKYRMMSGTPIDVAARMATRWAPACGPIAMAAWRTLRSGLVSGPKNLLFSPIVFVLTQYREVTVPLEVVFIISSYRTALPGIEHSKCRRNNARNDHNDRRWVCNGGTGTFPTRPKKHSYQRCCLLMRRRRKNRVIWKKEPNNKCIEKRKP